MSKRIDLLLVENGLASSRTQAQRWVAEGKVELNEGGRWEVVRKPSLKLDTNSELRIHRDDSDRYVSRGGLKLSGILQDINLSVKACRCLDIGQSTGGFTDCLLQAGASKVVGVDVGHDQLAQSLRADPRVVCLEGVNARELPQELLLAHTEGSGFDIAVMDVSFISQTKILPGIPGLLCSGGSLISLVKPQFELGAENVGKGGIVRDESLYPVLEREVTALCEELGLTVRCYQPSQITGGDGNREFLLWAVKG